MRELQPSSGKLYRQMGADPGVSGILRDASRTLFSYAPTVGRPQPESVEARMGQIADRVTQQLQESDLDATLVPEARSLILGMVALLPEYPPQNQVERAKAASITHKLVRYTYLASLDTASDLERETVYAILHTIVDVKNFLQESPLKGDLALWFAGFRNELAFVRNLADSGWSVYLPEGLGTNEADNEALQFDVMRGVDVIGVSPEGNVFFFDLSRESALFHRPFSIRKPANIRITGHGNQFIANTLEQIVEDTSPGFLSLEDELSRRRIMKLAIFLHRPQQMLEEPWYTDPNHQSFLRKIGEYKPGFGQQLLTEVLSFLRRDAESTIEY